MFPKETVAIKGIRSYYKNLSKEALKSQNAMIREVSALNRKKISGRLDWMFPGKQTGAMTKTSQMYSAEEKMGERQKLAALRQTESYFKKNTTALRSLNVERGRSRDRIKRQVFDTNRLIKAQGLDRVKSLQLRKEVARLSRQFSKTGDLVQYKIALKRIGDQARRTQKPLKSLKSTMTQLLSTGMGAGLGGMMGGMGGAFIGGAGFSKMGLAGAGAAGIGMFGIAAAKTGMQLEGIQNTMRMITDSVGEARKEFGFISNMALKMGTDMTTSAEGYTKLAVAAGDKVQRAELQEMFVAFNKYSIAVGQSTFRYEKSLQALTQMFDKGGVYAEELRQQLA